MIKNIADNFRAACRRTARGCVLLVCTVMTLALSSCCTTPIDPATPTLISVQGHGTFDTHNNVFTFEKPLRDETSIPFKVTHHVGSRVRFTVPYPTSIELAIDGKPLTKVDPQMSSHYRYTGTIENPGGNPATWIVGITTPFDMPLYGTIGPAGAPNRPALYRLTIVNVSGSKRSQPLTITYQQPTLDLYTYIPAVGTGSSSTTHNFDPPSSGGPCAGGASEQSITICFKHPTFMSQQVTVSSCSYADALKLFVHQYPPPWSHTQGPCGP